jgi:hypothetical protein
MIGAAFYEAASRSRDGDVLGARRRARMLAPQRSPSGTLC